MSNGIYGDRTRGLRSAWDDRVGVVTHTAAGKELQALFNDVGLFPSRSQIFEMVQPFEDAGDFGQHVFCLGGGNQAAPFALEKWEFDRP